MHEIKDPARALVRIGYDSRVHKTFRGPKADERFANEMSEWGQATCAPMGTQQIAVSGALFAIERPARAVTEHR